MNREPISIAIYNLLSGITFNDGTPQQFATKSRRAKIYGNTDIGAQPAFFLIAPDENDAQPDMGLTEYHLHYVCLIYFTAPEDLTAAPLPDTTFNAILTAIEAVLPVNSSLQDLRGTPAANFTWPRNVINVWIDGKVEKVGGILDTQCALIVPITVLAGI